MNPFTLLQYSPDFLSRGKNLSLRLSAKRVTLFDADLAQLIQDLFVALDQSGGVGLAAPQVGVQQRIFVIGIPDDRRFNEGYREHMDLQFPVRIACINPRITYRSGDSFKDYEGCLCIPGFKGLVPRSSRITMTYQNERGETFTIKAQDFFARVIQHEYDHLDGKLYIDRMEESDELISVEVSRIEE